MYNKLINSDQLGRVIQKVADKIDGVSNSLVETANALQTDIDNLGDVCQDLDGRTDTIESIIPAAASSSNKLADKDFVNSSIATNTATFKGTVSSVAALEDITGADENDYAFVIGQDSSGNTTYSRYKYVTGSGWTFEYTLNNSSFTAEQWAAIQSGITDTLVSKLIALPTNTSLQSLLDGKVDKVTGKGLSTNDYTTAEKNKLSGIASGAQVNILEGVQLNGTDLTITDKKVNLPAYPTTLPASDVYAWAKAANKPSYTYDEVGVTKSVITALLGTDTYAPYNSAGYLPLTGGIVSSNSFRPLAIDSTYSNVTELGVANNGTVYSGFGYLNGFTFIGVEISETGFPKIAIRHFDGAPIYSPDNFTTNYTIYHSGNSNLSTVPWSCSTLTASGDIHTDTRLTFSGMNIGWWDGSNNRIESESRPLLITSYDYPIYIGHNGFGNDIFIATNGNVGIGTTAPEYKLDVRGVMRSTYLMCYHNGQSEDAGYIGCGSSANVIQIVANSGYNIALNSGAVGIGTNSPSQKLHVDGNILSTGSLILGSTSLSEAQLQSLLNLLN